METATEDEEHNYGTRLLWYAAAGVLSIFIFFLTVFVAACFVFGSDKVGQFGDSFGVMNAMFSALAFAAVLVSIQMQMREFKVSLRELMQSTKAHTESAQLQKEVSELQRFSTLFSAIELLPKLDERISNTQISTYEVACGLNSLREQRLAVLKFVKQESGLRDQDFSTKVEMDGIVKCNSIIEMTNATAAYLAIHVAKSHEALSHIELNDLVALPLRKKAAEKHSDYLKAYNALLTLFPQSEEARLVKEVADILDILNDTKKSAKPNAAELSERKEKLLSLSSKVLFAIMNGKAL